MATIFGSETDPNDKKKKKPWGDLSWTSKPPSGGDESDEPDVLPYEVGQTITCRGEKDDEWTSGVVIKATKNLITVEVEVEGRTMTYRIPPSWPFVM
ncbi:MAG TPA: hypothetical protein VJ246_04065 [Patescibacteria group bacterium]|nr:hypothetical protein [Patescibacteria group bacterium]